MSQGIKETAELLEGLNLLALEIISLAKDGVQLPDVLSLFAALKNKENLGEKLFKAYNGFKEIPQEVKDLDAKEIVELVVHQAQFVPKIFDALKK